ncbi:MAG: malate synthase G [Ilumatobacteraceae bacterium]
MQKKADLQVDEQLVDFVENEVLPAIGLEPLRFWSGLSGLIAAMSARNRELLAERDSLQSSIDSWHRAQVGRPHDADAYRAFLSEIGYLHTDGEPFSIETTNVDPEISMIAGPQLVVPVTNARYALNAANARWGSLYDAVYGTDVLGVSPSAGPYDRVRGDRVIAWVRRFLDDVVPLQGASHVDITSYTVDGSRLVAHLDDHPHELRDDSAFVGHRGAADDPSAIVLVHHGLHIELIIDRTTEVGAADRAGVSDVLLESAVTTIIDFEDSVATVSVAEKVDAYRNWLGLMAGSLTASVAKDGSSFVRRLNSDRTAIGADGSTAQLRGRSLLLCRNVGLHMQTDAVRDSDGNPIFEGLLDAMLTVAIAMVDLCRASTDANSPARSIYVVKPKLHGPDEVSFAVETFAQVEATLGLPADTVKIGIMDEERRTTVNLMECIRRASSRVVLINTGFLDRTGDEIHTAMEAGPMVPKPDMKNAVWIKAYENRNVDVGLACGFPGRAQIGKGMWAAPDLMADMLTQKIAHLEAGANCAWVPSPTAATLHATHYHRVDVFARQDQLRSRPMASLDDVLKLPLMTGAPADREREVDNNVQSILGYVVRWVDQGVGCSKVPDINNVALMEDRATCRISSQHVANWLRHGVVTRAQVETSLCRMAEVVDRQNAGDPRYRAMAPRFDGVAFRAASSLIFDGCSQPNGYIEPILIAHRREQLQCT